MRGRRARTRVTGAGRIRVTLAAGAMAALAALAQVAPVREPAPQSGEATPGAHPMDTGTHKPNRLAREKSPYLLQHAYNPVDWFPWGEEAFAKARQENKPIFLSVGYSTCHWCHVMERESFENETIAEALNRHFVSIKVDREERPDVDRVYMAFVQASTGGGGWPMSVFLTPDLKPFFGGTYFAPDARYGRPGFLDLLEKIAGTWETDRERVLASSSEILEALRHEAAPPGGAGRLPQAEALEQAYRQFSASYDPERGGFGGPPKFPRPATLNFMLRFHARRGERAALDMTLHTLREMAKGGMHDQLGGGFHRYSVDERWHVPHFEKMLYDQAQLALSYLEAFQITRETSYAEAARDILDYVLRDMTHPQGGFYSAEDADSAPDPAHPERKSEGAFYVWEEKEVRALLGEPLVDPFAYRYGVEPGGNVRHDPQGEFTGRNILFEAHPLEEVARRFKQDTAAVRRQIDEARRRLFGARARRPRPHLDDKVITAWNGLMISACARAGAALEEPRYLRAAERAADFLLGNLRDAGSGDLRRRWREGESAFTATAQDYAGVIQALLDLYEAGFDVERLRLAEALQERQIAIFWDEAGGGFWETAGADPHLLLRMKEDYDGAEPAANSLSALNLLRLAQMTERADLRSKAERTLGAFSSRLERQPFALPQMLVALDYSLSKPRQVVITGQPGAPDTLALLREVRSRFLPTTVVLLADGGKGQEELGRRLAFLRAMKPIDGKATAFVCENYACELPTTELAVVARLLDRKKPG